MPSMQFIYRPHGTKKGDERFCHECLDTRIRLDGINTCGAVTREGMMEPDDEDETKGKRGKKEHAALKAIMWSIWLP